MQVRRSMVKGIKGIVDTLGKLLPGASKEIKRGDIERDLLKSFLALLQDVLIEVQYSLKLIQDAVRRSLHACWLASPHRARCHATTSATTSVATVCIVHPARIAVVNSSVCWLRGVLTAPHPR
jgi:hypothetical protein